MMAVGCPYVDVDPPTPAVPGSRLDLPALIDNGTFLTHNIPTVTTSMTLGPGYYPNGMSISNGVDITLAPTSTSGPGTIFIFGGGTDKNNSNIGLYMTGGTLTGHGVTCYVTQNFSSGVYGLARITGGDVDLDSPGDWQNEQSGEFDLSLVSGLNGIAVWQDSTNPNEAHLNGEGNFSISGTIYFPDPIHLRLEGNLGDTGNQILCGSAEIHGTAVISVNYDNRNQGEASSVCLVK
jgi:hypothetical protein